jgi:uncharacterized membrane protein YkoI
VQRRTKFVAASAAAVALVIATGAGAAVASGGDDDATETPITGTALTRATAAALDETGGGRVTGTEVNDEEGKYEVEVTLDNGKQVDVHLDEHFAVIGQKADSRDDD